MIALAHFLQTIVLMMSTGFHFMLNNPAQIDQAPTISVCAACKKAYDRDAEDQETSRKILDWEFKSLR